MIDSFYIVDTFFVLFCWIEQIKLKHFVLFDTIKVANKFVSIMCLLLRTENVRRQYYTFGVKCSSHDVCVFDSINDNWINIKITWNINLLVINRIRKGKHDLYSFVPRLFFSSVRLYTIECSDQRSTTCVCVVEMSNETTHNTFRSSWFYSNESVVCFFSSRILWRFVLIVCTHS